MHQERTYRNLLRENNLASFNVVVNETDLFVHAAQPLKIITRDLILHYREYIETHIQKFPEFAKTLAPFPVSNQAPGIIKEMASAGKKADVGPMASVAGAIAENVGNDLLSYSNEVIVENGGDIFIKTNSSVIIGIYAGSSPLSLRVGLRVNSWDKPVSVCTSSGTIGHSLSFGKADAVCVVSGSCCLADAAATSIGNRVKSKADIKQAIYFGKNIAGITGLVVIMDDEIGMWGNIEIVKLKRKKG